MMYGEKKKSDYNMQIGILSAIAITLTVFGHGSVTSASFDGLFIYDSFHMPLFIFISGYFIKNEVSFKDFPHYLWRRTKRLLIPFLLWHLFDGFLAVILYKKLGILWGGGNVYLERLVRPFTEGNVFFGFNDASWFILVLFLVSVIDYLLRCSLKKLKYGQIIISLVSLVVAIAGVEISRTAEHTEYLVAGTRLMYMFFWYEAGFFYRKYLEKIDTLPNVVYIVLCVTLQILVVSGVDRADAEVWRSIFHNDAVFTLILAGNGIALWLRISKILEPALRDSEFVRYVATHTFGIMMMHTFGFFFVNTFYYLLCTKGIACRDFDIGMYQFALWYHYIPRGINGLIVIYPISGFAFSLLCCYVVDIILKKTGRLSFGEKAIRTGAN